MDKHIEEIISEISKELKITRPRVEKVIQHIFSWQRNEFIKARYSEYYWKYFGTFKLIQKRWDKKIQRENDKKMKEDENNNNNNNKTNNLT